LSEVVVVGRRRSNLVVVPYRGAKEFANQPVSAVESRNMQGAGLRCTGEKLRHSGGASAYAYAAATSISLSSDPLCVVDDIPLNDGNYSDIGQPGNQSLNALSDINPNDIASIEGY
jgi:hypothetical protein